MTKITIFNSDRRCVRYDGCTLTLSPTTPTAVYKKKSTSTRTPAVYFVQLTSFLEFLKQFLRTAKVTDKVTRNLQTASA